MRAGNLLEPPKVAAAWGTGLIGKEPEKKAHPAQQHHFCLLVPLFCLPKDKVQLMEKQSQGVGLGARAQGERGALSRAPKPSLGFSPIVSSL